MTITASQLKAARALLAWSRVRLAVKSGVGDGVIARFERGQCVPPGATLERLMRALEAGGVAFLGGSKPSVKLKTVGIPADKLDAANDE
jgi:predicted transcriptional regulator